MYKTKLGVSVGLVGAAMYLGGYFGGYFVAILLAGYILLFEENMWLRKTSVKAIALMFAFSLISSVLNLIPDAIDVINSLCNIFEGDFHIYVINRIISFLQMSISFIKTLLFLALALFAMNQGTITLPVIDTMINKNMD